MHSPWRMSPVSYSSYPWPSCSTTSLDQGEINCWFFMQPDKAIRKDVFGQTTLYWLQIMICSQLPAVSLRKVRPGWVCAEVPAEPKQCSVISSLRKTMAFLYGCHEHNMGARLTQTSSLCLDSRSSLKKERKRESLAFKIRKKVGVCKLNKDKLLKVSQLLWVVL